jgi:hypothetical protein
VFDPIGAEEQVREAADRAYKANPMLAGDLVPPPSWIRGIRIHIDFAAEVRALGPGFAAEVSYKNGVPVPYGTKGSIRADAVYGPITHPVFAVELKSGLATVTNAEANAYYANLPWGTRLVPIVESPGP